MEYIDCLAVHFIGSDVNNVLLKTKDWLIANQYWIFLGILLGWFGYLLNLSWLKWPHLITDFGREAYVAWQLSEGSVLYHDINYHYGPLASLINGGLMFLFGNTLSTLFYANTAFVLIFTVVFYNLFSRISSPFIGLFVLMVFLTCNAFAHPGYYGIYNFITPYSYDIIYGFYLISILILISIRLHTINSNNYFYYITIGIITGLTTLTKPEIIAASYFTIILLFLTISTNLHYTKILKYVFITTSGIIFSIALVFTYFILTSDIKTALRAVSMSWITIFDSSVSELKFFKEVSGTDNIIYNLLRSILSAVSIYALYILVTYVYTKSVTASHKYITPFFCIIFISIGYILGFTWLIYGVPIILLIDFFRNFKKYKNKNIIALFFILWGLTFSLKKILSFSILHYGFVLSVPALISLSLITFFKKKHSAAPHLLLLYLLFGISLKIFILSHEKYSIKTELININNNKIYSYNEFPDGTTKMMSYINNFLLEHTPAETTFYVIPEGLLHNFLTHRSTGLPYTALGPHEWLLYGEKRIISDFQQSPPDYIHYRFQQNFEGWGIFGSSPQYGLEFMQWVKQDYDAIIIINGDPLETNKFGGVLYRHKRLRPLPAADQNGIGESG